MLLGVGSFFGLIYYLCLERDLEFVYGVLYSFYAFFLLQWIFPYAFFTVRDRRWLTEMIRGQGRARGQGPEKRTRRHFKTHHFFHSNGVKDLNSLQI